ncbi:MAG TPA: porin family protein [Emticicia sp.]
MGIGYALIMVNNKRDKYILLQMKKLPYLKQLLAVFCLVTCLQNLGFSQEKQKKVLFGLYGGMNTSKITPPPNKTSGMKFGTTYQWNSSYNFGGFIDLYFAKRLYLESGVSLISRKSNTSPRSVNTISFSTYDNGVKNYTLDLYTKFDHEALAVQIPLALHVDIIKTKKFRTNIYAGLVLENNIRYEVKETNSLGWKPIIPTQDILDNASKYTNGWWGGQATKFNKTTYGGMIGVGLNYKRIGLDINYNGTERTAYYTIGIAGPAHFKMPSFMMNLRFQIN